jgi:hypothetical protein
MNLIRLFFEDGAANGGGAAPVEGAATNTTDVKDADHAGAPAGDKTPEAKIPVNAFTEDEIKTFGFDSKEQMIEALKKLKETSKSDAEKEKEELIKEADFMRYAAERNLVNDDFKNYKSLQAKNERDLVFERYAQEEKADNPDLTDEEIKEAFESEYKLNSENAKAKTKGENRLKKEAAEIRKPAVDAWEKAQSAFKEDTQLFQKNKVYKGIEKEVISKAIPEKITLKLKDGDTDIPLDVDVAKEIKEKAEKLFGGEKGLVKFLVHDGTPEQFSENLKARINSFVDAEVSKVAVQLALEAGIKIGTKKGSTVGAENLFGLKQGDGTGRQQTQEVSLEDSNKKIADARAKAKNNR